MVQPEVQPAAEDAAAEDERLQNLRSPRKQKGTIGRLHGATEDATTEEWRTREAGALWWRWTIGRLYGATEDATAEDVVNA